MRVPLYVVTKIHETLRPKDAVDFFDCFNFFLILLSVDPNFQISIPTLGCVVGVQARKGIRGGLMSTAFLRLAREHVDRSCCASSASAAMFLKAADDLRRGQINPIIQSTNHKDAVRVELSGSYRASRILGPASNCIVSRSSTCAFSDS